MKKSVAIISAVVVLGAGAAGTVQWQKSSAQRAALVAAIPTHPDVSRFPPEFAHRLAAAEDLARNGPDRQEGIAELKRDGGAPPEVGNKGFSPELVIRGSTGPLRSR